MKDLKAMIRPIAFALSLTLAATAVFAHETIPIRCTITLKDRPKDGPLYRNDT